MLQHIICDIPIQDETLALDLIRAVGPGGEFVTHDHKLAHFRNVWYPELLYRGGAKAWGDPEDPLFEQRVNARTRQLIESHQPKPLSDTVVQRIHQVVARAEERYDTT